MRVVAEPATTDEDDLAAIAAVGRVLIADDHPDIVFVLRKVVERFLPDAEIFEARNGIDTCIKIGSTRPDLLLLDIMMPGMDGFAGPA